MGDKNVNLPPGFRFYPTDEELIVHFLQRKTSLLPFHPDVIPDLDLYPYDPWDLQGKALGEGKQWYFYSRRTQNRSTRNGYWSSVGVEEPVYNGASTNKIGIKTCSVFFLAAGVKTNWFMQEYRLCDSASSSRSSNRSRSHSKNTNDRRRWVICRVFEQSCDDDDDGGDGDGTQLSCLDEVFLSLDDLDEISLPS